jgi:hypothetical protein
MKTNLKIGLAFVLGAATGALVANKYLKTKYEKIADEEIASVKAVYWTKTNPEAAAYAKKDVEYTEEVYKQHQQAAKSAAEQAKENPDIAKYAEKLHKEGYTNYSTAAKPDTPDLGEPYVIPPEDFGEFDDYEKISLIYWADRVLTDDNNEVVEDLEGSVGIDSLTTFGEYEDDSVFVRNSRLRCDYEILLDQRNFEDVIHAGPKRLED